MKEFVSRRSKKYSYLMNDDSKYEKAKLTKKCVTETKFNDYKNYQFNKKIILKS